MNALFYVDPAAHEYISGSKYDPFYDDKILPAFYDFLKKYYTKDEQ
jgi:hypothetical protein